MDKDYEELGDSLVGSELVCNESSTASSTTIFNTASTTASNDASITLSTIACESVINAANQEIGSSTVGVGNLTNN